MDTPKLSFIDKLFKQLEEQGKITKVDPDQCEQQSKNIDEKMKDFAKEKQQKLAKDRSEFANKSF